MLSAVRCPPGTFCGPTAIAAILHADIDIVMEACRDAILMTDGPRRPMKVKGMTLQQISIVIEMLSGVDMTYKNWAYFNQGEPTIVREWLETGRSKLIYERNILVCGGLRGSLHVMAVHKETAVDSLSKGCIVPLQHLTMRRCLLDSYISIDADIRIHPEAIKAYGKTEHTTCPDARRRAASILRE